MCGHARRFGSPSAGFIAYLRVPSPPPGKTRCPAPVEDAFTSAAQGVVVVGGLLAGHALTANLACEMVALAAVSSPPAPSRKNATLRVVRVARAFVSGHPRPMRPAGLAVAGRRSSYPSRIRVKRAATLGAAGRQGRYARPARAGRSEHYQPKPRPGKDASGRECENTRDTAVAGLALCGGNRRGRGEGGETSEKRTGAAVGHVTCVSGRKGRDGWRVIGAAA